MPEREFVHFPKILRAEKVTCFITEKIDGTNAQVVVDHDAYNALYVMAGSRNRWIQPEPATADNFGFARWVQGNAEMLKRLGPGTHYGEWYGQGIGRGYGMTERRWALFDRRMWSPEELTVRELDTIGVECVPILATCSIANLASTMAHLDVQLGTVGSALVHGWRQPEGYVVSVGDIRFKVTDNGNKSKWLAAAQDGLDRRLNAVDEVGAAAAIADCGPENVMLGDW